MENPANHAGFTYTLDGQWVSQKRVPVTGEEAAMFHGMRVLTRVALSHEVRLQVVGGPGSLGIAAQAMRKRDKLSKGNIQAHSMFGVR